MAVQSVSSCWVKYSWYVIMERFYCEETNSYKELFGSSIFSSSLAKYSTMLLVQINIQHLGFICRFKAKFVVLVKSFWYWYALFKYINVFVGILTNFFTLFVFHLDMSRRKWMDSFTATQKTIARIFVLFNHWLLGMPYNLHFNKMDCWW